MLFKHGWYCYIFLIHNVATAFHKKKLNKWPGIKVLYFMGTGQFIVHFDSKGMIYISVFTCLDIYRPLYFIKFR